MEAEIGDCPNFRVSENGTVPFAAYSPEIAPKSKAPRAGREKRYVTFNWSSFLRSVVRCRPSRWAAAKH